MSRIAKRYAKALFSLANGDLSSARRQLAALDVLRTLFDRPDSGKVLLSPVMPPDLKKNLLDYGLDKADAEQDVRNLVRTVVEAGRVAELPKVATAFADLIDEAEGIARANVISAVSLSDAETDDIARTLGDVLKKKVKVEPAVDPALLGGFVVEVGNYRIDMSLKTKLDGLSQSAVQDTLR